MLFPKLSKAKINEYLSDIGIFLNHFTKWMSSNLIGIFVGPDIAKLMKSEQFNEQLLPDELSAWKDINDIIHNVFRKTRSSGARTYVDSMVKAFDKLGIHMSTKIHYLNSRMDSLVRQITTESDEHGERFHQTCAPIEN